ncbi:MAG: zinc-ribbon domain-containing protein, partial [Stellaceae bacterium]
MIVTCPECATRYRVADDALDAPHGRRVRCARCGHVWLHRPDPQSEPPGDPPPLRVVPPMLPAERPRGRGMRRMAAAL